MAPTEQPVSHKVLLVDDDDAVRAMMNTTLERKGFDVVAAASVTEALGHIATESFDVLITDLHMPDPGDGFTVVTAMRHSQPAALTLLVSGYPDVQSAMAAILLEADEIIVKPFDVGKLAELVRTKLATRKPSARVEKERVGVILQRCLPGIVEAWLLRAKQSKELSWLPLSDNARTGHLPKLVEDLALRLSKATASTSKEPDASDSPSAMAHGELRYLQGYTPAMLVHESRILQVTIFGTLQSNMNHLDFSLLLPDVMTIADEVDSQLTQSMDSYMRVMRKTAA
ncbi:MAG: response regulator [Candidatus Sulfotelmatobacter sp.]